MRKRMFLVRCTSEGVLQKIPDSLRHILVLDVLVFIINLFVKKKKTCLGWYPALLYNMKTWLSEIVLVQPYPATKNKCWSLEAARQRDNKTYPYTKLHFLSVNLHLVYLQNKSAPRDIWSFGAKERTRKSTPIVALVSSSGNHCSSENLSSKLDLPTEELPIRRSLTLIMGWFDVVNVVVGAIRVYRLRNTLHRVIWDDGSRQVKLRLVLPKRWIQINEVRWWRRDKVIIAHMS
jgi:hypothetical protein